MSGIEVAGLVLGAFPIAISAIKQYYNLVTRVAVGQREEAYSTLTENYARYKLLTDENGFVYTSLLRIMFPDASFVMEQVERYVLRADNQHVVAFIKSYTSSFNMIGVAGAIIAQVAISAISLAGLEDSHWTVEAFFVASLVTGCLSVFFSCAVSPAFHGLHTAEDIKDFLTKPMSFENTRKFNLIVSKARGRKAQVNEFSEDEISELKQLADAERWKVPSVYAALMLSTPNTLLGFSLNTFLIGLGIYLGKLYTAKLIPSYGSGSIGILAFYLVSAVGGIGMYKISESLKYLENTSLKYWHSILETKTEQVGEDALSGEGDAGPPPTPSHFPQSRHSREGSRVHFTTQDETVNHTANPDGLHLTEQPTTSTQHDSLLVTEEQGSPSPCVTSNTASSNEAPGTPRLSPENIQNILRELIQSQEESLRLNRRLLEAFSNE